MKILNLLIVSFLLVVASLAENNFEIMARGACGISARTACQAIFIQGRKYSDKKPYIEELEGLYSMVVDLTVNMTGKYVEASARFDRPRIVVKASLTSMGCQLDSFTKVEPYQYRGQQQNLPVSSTKIASLEAVLDRQFAIKEIKTRAIVVLVDGKIQAERYLAPEWTQDSVQLGWSMSKSVLSTLIGIRNGEGKFNVTEKVLAPEWTAPNDPRREITIDQMLKMSSGLRFRETKIDPESDLLKMLYISKSHAKYAASLPLEQAPGTKWYYSSGTSNILSRRLRSTFSSDQEYWNYPHKMLFEPLGMSPKSVFEIDGAGDLIGSSYCFLTARDWAKYGQLYLQDGIWNGKRILPVGWVRYTITPAPQSRGNYAGHWWLPGDRLPGVRADCFLALGHEAQIVMVCPSKKLVVVRLGLTRVDWSENNFLHDVYNAIP